MNKLSNLTKNHILFEKIISKLRKAREKPDVELHLEAQSELINNVVPILKTCNFEQIEFEFFYDLIYDYSTTMPSSTRDEFLIFKSSIRWLSYPPLIEERKIFTDDIMKLIKFNEMKEHELKQVFSTIDTCPLSNLKQFLQNIQETMIANHKINLNSLFVDCFKI